MEVKEITYGNVWKKEMTKLRKDAIIDIAANIGKDKEKAQAELENAMKLLIEARDWLKEEASIKMRNGANRYVVDSYDDKAYKLTNFINESRK